MYFKRLVLASLVLAAGCDDGGGGGSPVDASVPVDAAPDAARDAAADAAQPDRGAPDATPPPVDAAPVDAGPPPVDAAPPPDAACTQGEEGCTCGLNDFCNIGLVCTEGRCLPPCPAGTDGCPCAAGACDDGLLCDPAGARCRAPVDCDELECLEHQLCEVAEGPACLEACEEGFVWQADPPACVAIVPVGCADLACGDVGRVCVEDGGARCADCLPGLIEVGGACRAPVTCAELACDAAQRACVAAPGADAVCGACLDGFMEVAGACQAPGCEALDCGAQNRGCTPGEALCGACLAGFMDVDGACVAEPEGCAVLACGAQNRRCVELPEPACGACLAGFVEEAGACVAPPQANCGAGAPGSILADCQAEGRVCVADANGARCAGCQEGLVLSPDDTCVPPVACEDLDCADRGRACAGAPFAACGDCIAGTRPVDPDDPASACTPPLTCADIVCDDGEFCLEGNNSDALCSPAPCDAGEAFRLDRNVCVACGLLCGEEGETGRVAPFTQAFSDDCVCETESGYYADVAGAIRALPCDADGDGWVRLSARASIESADETIRDNARCQLRQITSVTLQNEVGQRYVLRSCEAGFVTPDAPPCGALPIGLYESVRNDDAVELGRDRDVPTYATGGVGRTLRPEELNSLTKACVSARGDHNHNGLADVAEHQDVDPPADLDAALRPFLSLSYFVELHRGFYEAPADGGVFGTYVIAERSRCSGAFPLAYGADEGSWWRSCMRNRDAGFDDDPSVFTPVGYDFARYACDAVDGTCPTPPPVTGDGPVDEVTPHDMCTLPTPDDGIWRGMGHHSQFRCVIVTNEADLTSPRSLAPQEITAAALYNGVQGTRTWQFNTCGVACPAGDGACANDCGPDGCDASSDTPGGLINPASPVLACAPSLQNDADAAFPAGTVGFVAGRYIDSPGTYVRGCINEWTPGSAEGPWKTMCPGYDVNPDGVVGDANPGNFGRLLCGCGFAYGGAECDLGCPSLGVDTDGDRVLDADVGGLHYGGDVQNPLCDAGYCPNDPASEDGGRKGFWMCGAFSVTSQHGADADDPHALVGDGFRLRGGVMPHGFTGRSCEGDDCAAGWQIRPASLTDLDP